MNRVNSASLSIVPEPLASYVPFGIHNDLREAILSKTFYPIYITGETGLGKTTTIEQVCAELGRELIRVNITCETDEDDLIGGFRLVDGQTVWQDGPVIEAMKRGAVLNLDEIDLGSHKIMCLQPILENARIFIKKTCKLVEAAPGFTIVATANTKGQGSSSGRFMGTNVLNEALLDRFGTTMVQDYPGSAVETRILNKILDYRGCPDADFTTKLVKWANGARKAADSGRSETISTRRLIHIVNAFAIYHDRIKAVSMGLARFDDENRLGLRTLYCNFDDTVAKPVTVSDDAEEPATV